jgi:dihydroorotate dehydrogenase
MATGVHSSQLFYRLIRPLLFRLEAESAHDLTLNGLRLAGRLAVSRWLLRTLFSVDDPRLVTEVFGLRFKNPVGLAAGYDKNGAAVNGLSALGFGHLEVGTVTRLPQVGNPRPRVHRLPPARALVNSMGFPNAGVDALPADLRPAAGQTASRRTPTRIGINVGKGRDTPLEQAATDYCALLRKVHSRGQADYVAVNVSSPNTRGLRQLQDRQALEGLLTSLVEVRDSLRPRLPLLVKLAPDLTDLELDDALAVLVGVGGSGVDGVIVANTTTSRDGVPEAAKLAGGLSGAPLRKRSTAMIRYVASQAGERLAIVGVGGILEPADAVEKLQAGASLVQLFTGLVYGGPGLVRAINQELLRLCARDGLASVRDLNRYRPVPAGAPR